MSESRVVYQANQKGLRFYADFERAKLVFDALIARLREKGYPYNQAHVPQADQFLPQNLKRGSKEHAVFLFMLCFWMRGGVESDTAALFLKQMYEGSPTTFRPESYLYNESDQSPESKATRNESLIREVTQVLTNYRLGQRVEENAPGWVYNMRKLARFWGGDPRRLMNDAPAFNVLTGRIIGKTRGKNGVFVNEDSPNGFMFFREKITAMIAYFLMDTGLVPMFYTPVPVDFHVLRLLVSNLIIRVEGKSPEESLGVNFMNTEVLRLAREVTERYCRESKISPIALCDSLWLLSRELCRRNPGNSGYVFDEKRRQDRLKLIQGQVENGTNGTILHIELDLGLNPDPALSTDVKPDSKNKAIEDVVLEVPEVLEEVAPEGRKRYMGLRYDTERLQTTRGFIKRLEGTCGRCPANGTCAYNISAGHYYVGGALVPERMRVVPSGRQLHFLGDAEFVRTHHAPVDPNVRFAEIDFHG